LLSIRAEGGAKSQSRMNREKTTKASLIYLLICRKKGEPDGVEGHLPPWEKYAIKDDKKPCVL
jgi:hypothetical protein